MSNVSIYVAVITAAAGVLGATISQLASALRESGQAKRDRQERYATAVREACENLLRAAGDLRTQVENNRSFRGDRTAMAARLEEVRNHAAATQLHEVSVGTLVPKLAESAGRVAAAARSVAMAAADHTDLERGWVAIDPDFTTLDASVDTFRREVLAYFQS